MQTRGEWPGPAEKDSVANSGERRYVTYVTRQCRGVPVLPGPSKRPVLPAKGDAPSPQPVVRHNGVSFSARAHSGSPCNALEGMRPTVESSYGLM